MNDLEQAARQALEALQMCANGEDDVLLTRDALASLRQALEQPKQKQEPEFFTHNVEQPHDWSEWVCPNPKGYLMKCCDCGVVHEVEFGVVRFKSETELEDCEPVNDPNLQAVFRMRRSEQWLPEDTAHRAGGLPMAQPERKPVAWCRSDTVSDWKGQILNVAYIFPSPKGLKNPIPLYTEPPKREWVGLTDEEIGLLTTGAGWSHLETSALLLFARAIESKLKEKNA